MSHRPRPARRPARQPARPPAPRPGGQPIRLLLVDDHPVVREGLRSCLARLPRLAIVGEAASGEDALRQAARLRPDVVLMDINMPGINGLVATARLRALVPAARVLILSVHENREYLAEVARCGARGYLLKDAAPEELIRAIEAVHGGEGFFSPPVAAAMLASLGGPALADAPPDAACLTTRERDVLVLVAAGLSSKAIGLRLGIAFSTVKTLRERLMRKLDLHSVAELAHFALAHGLCAPARARARAR